MSDHLCSNSLLNPFKFAYKPGHSTETALFEIVNDVLFSLDNGNISSVTFRDLSAAFDTIDHNILLNCLEHVFGIHSAALQWFSYLTNRTQTVSINNLKSDPAPVLYGVPQGSVLRPVLFVLYTTTLSDVIERHSIHHHSFADDMQLRNSAPPHHVSELVQSMQECIHDVKVWMSSNKLKLNDDKTEAMIVSSQRMSTSLPMPDSPTVGTSNAMFSQSVKTLGVMLGAHLTMKNQVINLVRTANFELRGIIPFITIFL